MGKSQKIANLLKISLDDAVVYCEEVRQLTGLGLKLPYDVIAQYIKEYKSNRPTTIQIANLISSQKNSINNSRFEKPKKKLSRLRGITLPPMAFGVLGTSVDAAEASNPSQPKQGLIHTSYLDHDRVSEEKLKHCPHGVLIGRVCAICDPQKFREMTGID